MTVVEAIEALQRIRDAEGADVPLYVRKHDHAGYPIREELDFELTRQANVFHADWVDADGMPIPSPVIVEVY